VLLLAAVTGLLALGMYLIQLGFPSLSILPGVVAVVVAVTLCPRLGRLDRAQTRLSRGRRRACTG
jgi:hypothetical protein